MSILLPETAQMLLQTAMASPLHELN